MYADPGTNDGWGPDLYGRLLYKNILHSKFCKSVEFHRVYDANEKVCVCVCVLGRVCVCACPCSLRLWVHAVVCVWVHAVVCVCGRRGGTA